MASSNQYRTGDESSPPLIQKALKKKKEKITWPALVKPTQHELFQYCCADEKQKKKHLTTTTNPPLIRFNLGCTA